MWKGLGINYNYAGIGSDYQADLTMLYNAGFKRVRLLMADYLDTAGINNWKTRLAFARTLAFTEISIGISSNPTPLTSGSIAAFNSARQTYAAFLEGLGDSRITFCMGNEEMYHRNGTLTDAQVRANETTQYGVLSGIYTIGKISYSMANGEMFPFFSDGNWPTKNNPDGDYVGVNLYTYPTGQTSGTFFRINLSSAKAWFGSSVVVTEFGPDHDGYNADRWGDRSFYAAQFAQQLQDIIDYDITCAMIYNFQDALFGCKSPNGTFRPHWYILRGLRQPVGIE
jgi:hypothetical protein